MLGRAGGTPGTFCPDAYLYSTLYVPVPSQLQTLAELVACLIFFHLFYSSHPTSISASPLSRPDQTLYRCTSSTHPQSYLSCIVASHLSFRPAIHPLPCPVPRLPAAHVLSLSENPLWPAYGYIVDDFASRTASSSQLNFWLKFWRRRSRYLAAFEIPPADT